MSVYIQEVLGLLKRNKKKKKLDKMRDHFEFGKLYHTSKLNTGASYNPTMEPFVVKWGDLVCEATEDLTRTQPGSGNVGFVPVYTDPEGTCSWDTLKDSIITQNAIGDTIQVNNGNLIVDLQLTAGSANILDLTNDRVVIVGVNGELEDDANFTMDGTTFTANVNVVHGTDVPAGTPAETTTINSNLKLEGPVYDSLGNLGGLNKVLVGLADGRVKWQDDDVVEALTYGALWQGDPTNYKVELPIGTADQILISDGTTFAWQDNPAAIIGEVCDVYRIPLWSPDNQSLGCSLLIQDGNSSTPATEVKNDGMLRNVGIVKLDSVAQDDTLTEVLVRDTGSANEVKFRDVGTIIPPTGFDTLTMSTTANWTQTFLNAYIGLDDTTVPYRLIKGMTTLTDGDTGVVVAENVKTGSLLADNAIRFPNGWGVVGNLFDNRISWAAGVDNGYPTSSLLYGESLKFTYHNYKIPGGPNNMLYWESCCKLFSQNTCPVASNSSFTANEDNAISDTVTMVDDGYGGYPGVYTVSGLADPSAGSLAFQTITGAFTFTPTANWYGTTSFTFSYNDGYCDSNTATVTLNILPVAEPPLWTSTDPVTANTYPTLTGGDTWTYNWTTNDPDHPCTALDYTVTVNDGSGAVEIFPAAGSSWLSFTNNNNCTGTLTGTYPLTGGNFDVIMTVKDPDNLVDTQTFTIGGLAVTKDTYFVFTSDTSGSMNTTIQTTAAMSSVPEVRKTSNGTQSGSTSLQLSFGGGTPGRVNDPSGGTDDAHLCIVNGMTVSGNGIASGTTVVSGGGGTTLVLSQVQNSSNGDVITFSLTQAQKTADYNSTTNFRGLLQDFYATGGTAASGNSDPATNGQDMYDSHLYWYHSGQERPLGYLGFQVQGGAAVATIGPGGYFPDAEQIVVTAWADESNNSNIGYKASPGETGAGTWNDRANTTNADLVDDCVTTKAFIAALETAAGNNTIYRGIAFRVLNGTSTQDLEQIMGPNGYAQTGGRTANGYDSSFNPEALAYTVNTQSLYLESNGAPTRITYSGNVTNGGTTSYYYNLVRAELNAIGFSL